MAFKTAQKKMRQVNIEKFLIQIRMASTFIDVVIQPWTSDRLMWLFWFEKAVWHELYFPKI